METTSHEKEGGVMPQHSTGQAGVSADSASDDFARQAEQAPPGLLAEFWDFLIHNKKWWLTPIIIVLLVATAFILLSGTAVGPFIYPGL
jgi:hypothetical protein